MPRSRQLIVQWLAPVAIGLLVVLVAGRAFSGGDVPLPLTTGPAPWPLPDRQGDRIRAAKLPGYVKSGPTAHPHAHLDIFVDGRPVAIPAGLGLPRPYSPLHTHSESGFLHLEAGDRAAFTLGQLFTLWGVRPDASCVGVYCAPAKPAAFYVNGTRHPGSITTAPVVPYSQMVLVVGRSPPSIPERYDCHNAADIERLSCQTFMARSGSASTETETSDSRAVGIQRRSVHVVRWRS